MTIFDNAFDLLLKVEGGYSNNPADSGGATLYGITEAVARQEGYQGPMQSLPLETAKEIYKRRYWAPLCLDAIAEISEAIALKLFDTGVNMGIHTSATFLQRALNIFNRQQADFADLTKDGAVGPKVVTALSVFITKRNKQGEAVLLKALNSLQGIHYIELAESVPTNETFIYGWLNNRVA